MDDRQQAGAPKPSGSQGAPDTTNKLNYIQVVQAVEAGKQALSQNEKARAAMQQLPVISAAPQANPQANPQQNPQQQINQQNGQQGAINHPAAQGQAAAQAQAAGQAGDQAAAQAAGQAAVQAQVASTQNGAPQVASAAQQNASASTSARSSKKSDKEPEKVSKGRIAAIIALVVGAIVLISLLVFCWNQWLRGNDEQDIQGVWQIAGTESTITITEDYLQLTPDVKYPYTLDTTTKTISFAFQNLSGTGHYRFSLDRNQLAIIEGPEASVVAVFFEDLWWSARALFSLLVSQSMLDPGVETSAQLAQKAAEEQKAAEQAQADATGQQDGANTEISTSQYVLAKLLTQKAQAIKGIKSTSETSTETTELPVECTLLIRTSQSIDASDAEKNTIIIDLRQSSGNNTTDTTHDQTATDQQAQSGSQQAQTTDQQAQSGSQQAQSGNEQNNPSASQTNQNGQ